MKPARIFIFVIYEKSLKTLDAKINKNLNFTLGRIELNLQKLNIF